MPVLYPALRPIKINLDAPYEIDLPGNGEPTSSTCGEYVHTLACPDHKRHAKHVLKRCRRIACPTCYPSVIARQVARAEERTRKVKLLIQANAAKAGLKVNFGNDKHIEFSVDPDAYTYQQFEQDGGKTLLHAALLMLDGAFKDQFFGGTVVIHHVRYKHRDGSTCESDNCKKAHVPVWGPHVHFVGNGFVLDINEFIQKYPEWRYKNIPSRGKRDVSATLAYELTHALVATKRATGRSAKMLTYVGFLQDKKVRITDKYTVKEKVPCIVCGAPMHKYEGIPVPGNPLLLQPDPELKTDLGEAEVTREVRNYELRPSQKVKSPRITTGPLPLVLRRVKKDKRTFRPVGAPRIGERYETPQVRQTEKTPATGTRTPGQAPPQEG